jgi:rod shape-determining protein MreC
VARVTTIDREPGRTFARVEAEPLAALDRGREVLLIRARASSNGEPAPPADAADAMPDESPAPAGDAPAPDAAGPDRAPEDAR